MSHLRGIVRRSVWECGDHSFALGSTDCGWPVDWLVADAGGDRVDLSETWVLLPTRQAGRRLRKPWRGLAVNEAVFFRLEQVRRFSY